MDLTEIADHRETVVYPELFGAQGRGMIAMQAEVFKAFGDVTVDPNWLKAGVMEFAPTDARPTWLYVTSGYSTPYGVDSATFDPEGESGAGAEFVMQTDKQTDWSVVRLQSVLALDMLQSSGQLGGDGPLAFFDQLPGKFPINGNDRCLLKTLMLCPPEGIPASFALPSGQVALMVVTAITDAEQQFAAQFGMDHLADKLRAADAMMVIRPDRPSVV